MKCQASDDPGSYFSWVGETSRVVLPTPRWRLGVQCRKSVRDPIDLHRPHERTKEVMARPHWGWKPELLAALPRTHQSRRWRQEEEQRELIP